MSLAPSIIRGSFGNLYGSAQLSVLMELFMAEVDQYEDKRAKLAQLINHDRDIWQYGEVYGLPVFPVVAEGSEYSATPPNQGASKTISISKYGRVAAISEEWAQDGKMNLVGNVVKMLARAALETQSVLFFNLFNNGFGSENSADGQDIFSTAHTLPSGGTFANRLATDADLSVSSLETMLTGFMTNFVDDGGIIFKIKPKYLVVHPSNYRLAKELIGSDLKPETADNNMNSFKQEGMEVCVSPHLSDSDAWFLVSDPMENGLRVIVRNGVETKVAGPDVGFMTDALLWKTRFREGYGAVHPYGLFGTSGA